MKPIIDSYVYQAEFQTDSDGNRWQKVWRRRVLDITQDRIRLSVAESMRRKRSFQDVVASVTILPLAASTHGRW